MSLLDGNKLFLPPLRPFQTFHFLIVSCFSILDRLSSKFRHSRSCCGLKRVRVSARRKTFSFMNDSIWYLENQFGSDRGWSSPPETRPFLAHDQQKFNLNKYFCPRLGESKCSLISCGRNCFECGFKPWYESSWNQIAQGSTAPHMKF